MHLLSFHHGYAHPTAQTTKSGPSRLQPSRLPSLAHAAETFYHTMTNSVLSKSGIASTTKSSKLLTRDVLCKSGFQRKYLDCYDTCISETMQGRLHYIWQLNCSSCGKKNSWLCYTMLHQFTVWHHFYWGPLLFRRHFLLHCKCLLYNQFYSLCYTSFYVACAFVICLIKYLLTYLQSVKRKPVLAYAISFMNIDGTGKFCHSTVWNKQKSNETLLKKEME